MSNTLRKTFAIFFLVAPLVLYYQNVFMGSHLTCLSYEQPSNMVTFFREMKTCPEPYRYIFRTFMWFYSSIVVMTLVDLYLSTLCSLLFFVGVFALLS